MRNKKYETMLKAIKRTVEHAKTIEDLLDRVTTKLEREADRAGVNSPIEGALALVLEAREQLWNLTKVNCASVIGKTSTKRAT